MLALTISFRYTESMKTINKAKIEKAIELADILIEIKNLEKRAEELKAFFKSQFSEGTLEAGPVFISIEQRTRTSINIELLKADLGDIAKYQNVTTYSQLIAKRAA